MITQTNTWEGDNFRATWLDLPFECPRDQTAQATGVCFMETGEIVLVYGGEWNNPGGHSEDGETLEQALIREIWEEACAEVVQCRYIGSQRIENLTRDAAIYFQARFWAKVNLQPFQQSDEVSERMVVPPDDYLKWLCYGDTPIGKVLFERAFEVEKSR